MATNPVTGARYPWYRDAVWADNVGNGEIINVHRDEVTILFQWWEGTLTDRQDKSLLVVLDRDILRGHWTSRYGGLWQLREQDVK